jgi:hypothetical protein
MNPIYHSQLAQETHQEYSAKYGNHYNGDIPQQEIAAPVVRQRVALALGGLSILAALIISIL